MSFCKSDGLDEIIANNVGMSTKIASFTIIRATAGFVRVSCVSSVFLAARELLYLLMPFHTELSDIP